MSGLEVETCIRCERPVVFDPVCVGDTCGGMTLRGWDRCDACNAWQLSRRAVPHEVWRVAGSGRSVETGEARIRIEGGGLPELLCARLVTLPRLEEVLDAIAAGAVADPRALAAQLVEERRAAREAVLAAVAPQPVAQETEEGEAADGQLELLPAAAKTKKRRVA